MTKEDVRLSNAVLFLPPKGKYVDLVKLRKIRDCPDVSLFDLILLLMKKEENV